MYEVFGALQFARLLTSPSRWKGAAAERIASLRRRRTRRVERDAKLLKVRTRVCDHSRVVGRERQTAPIEDRAALRSANDVQQARVVGVATSAVGLDTELRTDE